MTGAIFAHLSACRGAGFGRGAGAGDCNGDGDGDRGSLGVSWGAGCSGPDMQAGFVGGWCRSRREVGRHGSVVRGHKSLIRRALQPGRGVAPQPLCPNFWLGHWRGGFVWHGNAGAQATASDGAAQMAGESGTAGWVQTQRPASQWRRIHGWLPRCVACVAVRGVERFHRKGILMARSRQCCAVPNSVQQLTVALSTVSVICLAG